MPILVRCRHSRIVDYFNKTTKYANSHAAPPSTSDILTGCVFTLCGICLSTPAGASGGCHTEAQASLPYRKGDCRQARGWLVRIVLSRIVTFRTKNLPTTIPTTNTATLPHPLPTSSCSLPVRSVRSGACPASGVNGRPAECGPGRAGGRSRNRMPVIIGTADRRAASAPR